MSDMKAFLHNGESINYFIKDIKRLTLQGGNRASAIMVICDEIGNQKNSFSIYDDEIKVIYAMPTDAERWFEKHLDEKKSK